MEDYIEHRKKDEELEKHEKQMRLKNRMSLFNQNPGFTNLEEELVKSNINQEFIVPTSKVTDPKINTLSEKINAEIKQLEYVKNEERSIADKRIGQEELENIEFLEKLHEKVNIVELVDKFSLLFKPLTMELEQIEIKKVERMKSLKLRRSASFS